ncbi:MAG: hypothetical protein V3V82_04265, partial [Acidimicrobiia bacterium]
MLSVAFGDAGLVAVGLDRDNGAVWTSPDGLTWQLVPDPDGVFTGLTVSDLAVGGLGYVAVGPHWATAEPTHGAVWTSPDGLSWTIAAELEALHILAISPGGPGFEGFVAVADTTDGAAVWVTPPVANVQDTP